MMPLRCSDQSFLCIDIKPLSLPIANCRLLRYSMLKPLEDNSNWQSAIGNRQLNLWICFSSAKITDDFHKLVGVFFMGEVTAIQKYDQSGARYRCMQSLAICERNLRIVIAPE